MQTLVMTKKKDSVKQFSKMTLRGQKQRLTLSEQRDSKSGLCFRVKHLDSQCAKMISNHKFKTLNSVLPYYKMLLFSWKVPANTKANSSVFRISELKKKQKKTPCLVCEAWGLGVVPYLSACTLSPPTMKTTCTLSLVKKF